MFIFLTLSTYLDRDVVSVLSSRAFAIRSRITNRSRELDYTVPIKEHAVYESHNSL